MRVISIARDFSPVPAGRFLSDGPNSGERLRDELILPALRSGEPVTVDLDGVEGYGSSVLEEAFGGLIRHGLLLDDLKAKLTVRAVSPAFKAYVAECWKYMERAAARVAA